MRSKFHSLNIRQSSCDLQFEKVANTCKDMSVPWKGVPRKGWWFSETQEKPIGAL
jgi:hypothetical protein